MLESISGKFLYFLSMVISALLWVQKVIFTGRNTLSEILGAATTGVSGERSQHCPEFLEAQPQFSSALCSPIETIVESTME